MKLFEVETAAHFGFRLEHLERLCQITDREGDLRIRRLHCGVRHPAGADGEGRRGEGAAARTLKWFGRLFPEYAKQKEERPSEARAHAHRSKRDRAESERTGAPDSRQDNGSSRSTRRR